MDRVPKKRVVLILLLLMLLASAPLFAFKVTAVTNSLVARTISEIPVDFEDSFFDAPATQYNHNLAQASIGLAVAAFRPVFDKENISPSQHAIQFMLDCGFTDLRTDDYDKNPSLYTVASIIGMKEMTDGNGEPYTLVAVAVCGGGYANEWLSNFTVGTGERHQGFDSAANLVVNRIFGYIGRRNIQGRIKIWITGFSRSAAVSNIAAADLVDSGAFRKEDIFAYLFATPRTTKDEDPERYDNIFSIVGQYDPVPQVPLSSWGFERYGITLHTSLEETDSDFWQKMQRANAVSQEFTGMDFWVNVPVNFQLHTLLGLVNELCPTQEIYAECIQDRLISMFSERTPNNILSHISQLSEDSRLVNDDNKEIATSLIDFAVRLAFESLLEVGDVGLMWNSNTTLTSNLMHEHTQDVYITWMLSSDNPEEIFTDKTEFTRLALFGLNQQYSLRVTEGPDDALLLEIRDGQVADGGDNPHTPFFNITETELLLTIPKDLEYTVWYSSPEENSLFSTLIVDYDSTEIAESYAILGVYNNHADDVLVYSTGERESQLRTVVLDATDFDENAQYLPPNFLAESLGVKPFALGWRGMVFTLILIPVGILMMVVLLIAVIIRLISRKRIGFLPFLFFALIMIGFLVGDLFFWLYKSVTPRTITKMAIGVVSMLFVAIGLMRRKKLGLLYTPEGRFHIVLGIFVFLCAVTDCVINYSFTAGMIMYGAIHAAMIVLYCREKRLSAYQWFAFSVGCMAVLLTVFIFRETLGSSVYKISAYGFLLSMLVVSGYRVSAPISLSCIMFALSDVVMVVYRRINSKLLVLHVILMCAYYLAIYCLAYSCYKIRSTEKPEEASVDAPSSPISSRVEEKVD